MYTYNHDKNIILITIMFIVVFSSLQTYVYVHYSFIICYKHVCYMQLNCHSFKKKEKSNISIHLAGCHVLNISNELENQVQLKPQVNI